MRCDLCRQPADFRVCTGTNGAGTNIRRNGYACTEHVEALKQKLEEEIADSERVLGNPLFPAVSRLNWGQIQVIPL